MSKFLPPPRALASAIIVGLVTSIATAYILAHVPALRAWMRKENGD